MTEFPTSFKCTVSSRFDGPENLKAVVQVTQKVTPVASVAVLPTFLHTSGMTNLQSFLHHPAPAATKISLKYVFIILHNYFVKQEVPIQSQKSITVYEQGFYCAAVARILLLGQNQSFVALEEEEDLPPTSQSSGTWRFSWCQTCLSRGDGSVLYSGLCLPVTQLYVNLIWIPRCDFLLPFPEPLREPLWWSLLPFYH